MRQGVIADAISPCELLQKLEIPEFDDKPALVGIEKPVDFRLTDWLLRGNAQKDFERGGPGDQDSRSRRSPGSNMRPTVLHGNSDR